MKPFRDAADVRREDFQSLRLLAQSLTVLGRENEAMEAMLQAIQRAERQLELDPTDARALSLGSGSLLVRTHRGGARSRPSVLQGDAREAAMIGRC